MLAGFFSIPIFTIMVVGMATRYVPPVAAKAGLVFFLAMNVLLQWVFDTGIHYLHLLAITFVVTALLMLIIGKIKPMAVPYQPAVIPVVSVEPWKHRHWYSAALLILMVLLFIIFSPLGLAK